jgi:hypothetical protein
MTKQLIAKKIQAFTGSNAAATYLKMQGYTLQQALQILFIK